jgi:endoglucanase
LRKSHVFLLITIISTLTFLFFSHVGAASYNYADAIAKATAWYDANRCGSDVATNNVFSSWRGACHTSDAVPGGFHDAGDHVKFALPAAFSASTLGWSLYEFKTEYDNAGATTKLLQELKIFTDYFLQCWNGSSMVIQIGDGGSDHAYWGPPETQTTSRPAYSSSTASDILGQTAAALALMYINYQSTNSTYANQCLTVAKAMYNVAKTNLGRGTAANGYYTSTSNYDDLSWAAIWLCVATGDTSYISSVDSWLEQKNDSGDNNYQKPWTFCWDDSTLGNLIMMYKLTGKQKYYNGIIWNFDWYTSTLTKTSYGLPYLNQWAVLRYDSAEAGLMYVMYKEFGLSSYITAANQIVDYCLGSNPSGICFLTNDGTNSIQHPHHRANQPNQSSSFTNGMVGALAGGPNSDDSVQDQVTNYTNNEVALDYNASFLLGCTGRSYIARGGPAGTPFPTPTPAPTSPPGNGTGLLGDYYQGTGFSGTPLLTRVDSTINFDWGSSAPDSSVPSDSFSVRWTGQIEARSTETYTFYLNHDDGARMWVNDVEIINNWTDHAAVEDIGAISLVMGQKYNITVEFYENDGDATCQLSWSTDTITKQIVPHTQLYNSSTTTTPTPTPSVTVTPTVTPAPSVTVTPTPTPTATGVAVTYTIVNDWGNGATVNVTIINNGTAAINGWTLDWTFPGNQKISNLWNGGYTQSGTSVAVTNLSYNNNITANGGTVSFGFNLSYSGTNAKPSSFSLNGTACQVQ